MNGSGWMSLLLVALALILPIAAMRDRKLPGGKLLKIAVVWVMIFAVATVILALMGG